MNNTFTLNDGETVQFVQDEHLYAVHEVMAYGIFADHHRRFFASKGMRWQFNSELQSIEAAGRSLVRAAHDEHSYMQYDDAEYNFSKEQAAEKCNMISAFCKEQGFDVANLNGCYAFAAECDHHGRENLPFPHVSAYARARRDNEGKGWWTALETAPKAQSLWSRIKAWFCNN